MKNISNILKEVKELKAKIIKENGNSIILKLSTKDLLLYLITKDTQQDKDIQSLKDKVNIMCVIITGITVTLLASLFIEKII
jgi:hypothetical protein